MTRALLYDRSCRCPRCRQRLVGIPTAVQRCPRCRARLEPGVVWRHRRYPGMIEVPAWTLKLLLIGLPLLSLSGWFLVTRHHDAVSNVAAVTGVSAFALPWFAIALARWLDPRKRVHEDMI